MVGLAAGTEHDFLCFHEVTHVRALRQHGAGAQPRERTDVCRTFADHALQIAVRLDHGARGQGNILEPGERADADAIAQHHTPLQDHVDVDLHVAADRDGATDVQPCRVQYACALRAQRTHFAQLPGAFKLGQLPWIVGTFGVLRVLHERHLGRRVIAGRRGKDVGQVILALRVRIGELRQPTAQCRGFGGDDAGIDGADAALFVGGVFLLDDRADLALGIAHDAPVAGRVGNLGHQHGQAARLRQQVAQRLAADQRHIAVQHQNGCRIRHFRHGLQHGMPGAQLLALLRPAQIGLIGECLPDRFTAVAVNDMDCFGLQLTRGIDDVGEHRAPGDRLQYLGQGRFHALASAGGEDDDVQGLGHGDVPLAAGRRGQAGSIAEPLLRTI
ncbi:hypothetical protein D3C71_941420 [compost metagenome]